MDTVPPQLSPLMCKALLSPRPKGHESPPYPRSNLRGERGESQPLSRPPYSRCLLGGEEGGEGADDHSRGERSRQGNSGSFSAAADRTKTLLPARQLARSGMVPLSPLAVTAMPLATFAVAGRGTGTILPRCTAVPQGVHVPL